jgi:hypothetical protein
MNNNILYLVVGGLAVAVVALGYEFYQQDQTPAPIQVSVSHPFQGDHRDHNGDRGHGDQHGSDHGNDNGGHDQNGHQPND